MIQHCPPFNFVGARKGANGTREELERNPPIAKAWVSPSLVTAVMERLTENQQRHSRLNLAFIIRNHLFDAAHDRYRIVWSKHMITAAGVAKMQRKGAEPELVLHLRDGEEERMGEQRWMRKILENLHARGGRGKDAVEDFLYLTLVHEASEIHERKQAETLTPDVKAEVRAEIEEAKAWFSLPPERKQGLKQLHVMLDDTYHTHQKIYSRELDLFESIGEENLGTIKGLLTLIEFVIGMPDYAREANYYPDDRARFQLSKSLFVDVIHNFASASRADKWVKEVESSNAFAGQPVTYAYTQNSKAQSAEAEETFTTAARILQTLQAENAEPGALPGNGQKQTGQKKTGQKKTVIEGFNKQIRKLDAIKRRLRLNEVLGIPAQLKAALEDNNLNRHFSCMDDFGIYHSLDLSRLDLRGLNLHSGQDERTASDYAREINHHKDERTDLRGAFMYGSDFSARSNFSNAQMDFVNAAYSNLSEIVFARTRAMGMIFYGANANEGQFERAQMNAVDARGMSANFARIQMKETNINGMKIWQSDVPGWQRAYVDISQQSTPGKNAEPAGANRDSLRDTLRNSLKAELDFLDDSFLDELVAIEETETFQREESWIELREVDGQLDFLKGRGIVFYSREDTLEYT